METAMHLPPGASSATSVAQVQALDTLTVQSSADEVRIVQPDSWPTAEMYGGWPAHHGDC
jgi:hypothetical protein